MRPPRDRLGLDTNGTETSKSLADHFGDFRAPHTRRARRRWGARGEGSSGRLRHGAGGAGLGGRAPAVGKEHFPESGGGRSGGLWGVLRARSSLTGEGHRKRACSTWPHLRHSADGQQELFCDPPLRLRPPAAALGLLASSDMTCRWLCGFWEGAHAPRLRSCARFAQLGAGHSSQPSQTAGASGAQAGSVQGVKRC